MEQQTQPGLQGNKTAAEGWLRVRLPRELRKRINIRAAQDEKSVPTLVADALRKYLDEAA